MGDHHLSEDERWAKEVHRRNTDSYDALDNALGGGALDSFSSGLRDAAAASQARAAARAAELARRWRAANAASEHIYDEAFKYYEAGEYDNALETFHKTIKAAESYGLYTGMSYVYIADILLNHQNDSKQSIKFAGDAVEYFENNQKDYDYSWNAFAYFARGEAYLNKMERQSGAEKEKTKQLAIADFREVLDFGLKDDPRYQKAAGYLKTMGEKFVGSRHPLLFNSLGGIAAAIFAYAFVHKHGGGGFGTIVGLIAGGIAFFIVGYGIIGAFIKKLSVKLPIVIALFVLDITYLIGNKKLFNVFMFLAIAGGIVLIIRSHLPKILEKRNKEADKKKQEARRIEIEANKTPEQKAADARFQEDLKLANRGDAQAQYNMGLHFYNGDGAAQNFGKAAKWWSKAAEQGHAEAKEALDKLQPEIAERSAESISEETSP